MTTYWEPSGILAAWSLGITPRGVTRPQSVAEVYAALTGPGFIRSQGGEVGRERLDPAAAAVMLKELFIGLDYCDLTGEETLATAGAGQKEITTGEAIHDWLHCRAAAKAKAGRIMTLKLRDLEGMTEIPLEQPRSKDVPF